MPLRSTIARGSGLRVALPCRVQSGVLTGPLKRAARLGSSGSCLWWDRRRLRYDGTPAAHADSPAARAAQHLRGAFLLCCSSLLLPGLLRRSCVLLGTLLRRHRPQAPRLRRRALARRQALVRRLRRGPRRRALARRRRLRRGRRRRVQALLRPRARLHRRHRGHLRRAHLRPRRPAPARRRRRRRGRRPLRRVGTWSIDSLPRQPTIKGSISTPRQLSRHGARWRLRLTWRRRHYRSTTTALTTRSSAPRPTACRYRPANCSARRARAGYSTVDRASQHCCPPRQKLWAAHAASAWPCGLKPIAPTPPSTRDTMWWCRPQPPAALACAWCSLPGCGLSLASV